MSNLLIVNYNSGLPYFGQQSHMFGSTSYFAYFRPTSLMSIKFSLILPISNQFLKVWEGILTLMFFPLTVVSAFLANKHARAFGQRLLSANITSFRRTPLRYLIKLRK